MKNVKYKYANLPVPGGGYVTGFSFHPYIKDVIYIRTDIGGVYKFERSTNTWYPLNEDIGSQNMAATYPAAIALDPHDEDTLYVISGVNDWSTDEKTNGIIGISRDGGKSFEYHDMPCFVHGNYSGRGTGKRLVVDEKDNNVLYYASQTDGLYKSEDKGLSWKSIDCNNEKHMTFVFVAEDRDVVIVGTAGVDTAEDNMRGHGMYISYDGCKTFEMLDMPENVMVADSAMNGYVPHRYSYDGKYFYCTINVTAYFSFNTPMSYSCDSGGVIAGRVIKYELDAEGRFDTYEDITPVEAYENGVRVDVEKASIREYGFGGISSCNAYPGLLTTATISRKRDQDIIYISFDYGDTWEIALYDIIVGDIRFNTSYMKPEYNGGFSLIHWLTDITINPKDPDEVWFNTGTGVFVGRNFTGSDRYFTDMCTGIEETVHMNVYSPVAGPVKVLDLIGDLGGFAFKELDKQCDNSFADSDGNRYITCINADYSDKLPENVIVAARGNWTGMTKGGIIRSTDYGQSFERLDMPFGINDYIDELSRRIEEPNTDPGLVAMSPDTKNILYCLCDNHRMTFKSLVYSNDGGAHFKKTCADACEDENIYIFSDRLDNDIFYAFADGMRVYVSCDKGASFSPVAAPLFADLDMQYFRNLPFVEIRPENGRSGVFYCALNNKGLVRLCIDARGGNVSCEHILKPDACCYSVGLGMLPGAKNYLDSEKAIYICGVLDGIYGFFRSYDQGKTFVRINSDKQQFGGINSIDGDSRKPGRFFIATGSFGLKYGEEEQDG